ncbi:MAG: hypothetical protein ABJF86_10690 [Tateyamaria sp.]|uniref:hypothetical protein n=1 Tax=Tateyamaria sp. TaxID=1929288 RepID=UPI0032780E8C
MRRVAVALISLLSTVFGLPALAQTQTSPIIPNLIAPDASTNLVSVTVDRGLTSAKQLRSADLRRLRTRFHEGGDVSSSELRALANAGDGLAAQRYVRILQTNDGANASDIAFFSAIAVGTGRIWTMGPMIEAMHLLDPATEPSDRVRKYISVLYPHAWAGNARALEAVVAFNGEGRLFGPLSQNTRDRISTELQKTGDGRIELGIAMGLLERIAASENPEPDLQEQARDLLERAGGSGHLAVATTAQNLLRLIDTPKVDGG